MKKLPKILTLFTIYFFQVLFCYAAFSKILDFENFQIQIAQSPILTAYAQVISYAVIIMELVLVLLLIFDKTRLAALYGTVFLMTAFTLYIYLILNYSEFIPCSCGGILEKMGWTEHLVFNISCVLIAFMVAVMEIKKIKENAIIQLFILCSSLLFALILVITMFLTSELMIKRDNNFTRRFIPHPFEKEAAIGLGANSYYFAGADKNLLYLGNRSAPQILTVIDTLFSIKREVKIKMEDHKIIFRSPTTHVKPPYFYVDDGSIPIIIRGKIQDLLGKVISRNQAYFSQLVVLDSLKFAIKTQDGETKKRVLGVIDLNNSTKITLNKNILGENVHGFFETDGMLLNDAQNRQLLYLFFYKNPIIRSDYQLTKKQPFKTIDTITHAKVEETTLSGGLHKMKTPPLTVNKKMFVHHGIIFNESNLIGKFEDRMVWKTAAVIDLYSSTKPLYHESFYLFYRNLKKPNQYFVYQNSLYVFYDKELVKYPFSKGLQQKFQSGEAENQSQSRHQQ